MNKRVCRGLWNSGESAHWRCEALATFVSESFIIVITRKQVDTCVATLPIPRSLG